MSFTQQYADDLAMGCVCDYDVPCASHPVGWNCATCLASGRRADGRTPNQVCPSHCGACEYACCCATHSYCSGQCEPEFGGHYCPEERIA